MSRKHIFVMILTIFLLGLLGVTFEIQKVEAIVTIYIRADGSIDPPDAPISTVDNITYTLTGNITSDGVNGIGVERGNIIIDGAGFTVEGTGATIGIYLYGMANVTIKNVNVKRYYGGICVHYSSNNTIIGNNITNNDSGIWLYYSSNNNVSGNNIASNTNNGIYLLGSSNNTIYHNNFINNTQQVYGASTNAWDDGYPSGGNYWSSYTGVDSDHDGIGDGWYEIDADNIDHYPLMGMFSSFNTSYGYAVDFVSNSSISNFSFNLSPIEVYPPEAILTFNLSGETGTEGFLRVCISKVLINGSYVIKFDDEIITNTTWPQVRELPCSNETYEYLYINYTHSEHTIIITGTTIIPEFPSFLILPVFMIATLLAVIVYKRKHALTLDRG
jgi:parallel beta-helix repeat protein